MKPWAAVVVTVAVSLLLDPLALAVRMTETMETGLALSAETAYVPADGVVG